MFNVKLCSFFEEGSETTTAISCPHYQLYKHRDGTYTITTYKDMTDTDGVERHIAPEDHEHLKGRSYSHSLYVENAAGKTVDCVRFDPILDK